MTGFSSYRTKCNAHLILPKCTLAIDQVQYTERVTSGPSDLATGDSNGEIARCKHKVTSTRLCSLDNTSALRRVFRHDSNI